METTLDLRSTSIARSDEREEYAEDGNEEFELHERINRCPRVYSSAPVRGLPVELWWNILEITDDPRALLSIGCTCETLRDIVRGIIEKRRDMDGLDGLLSDPTGGYFLSQAWINSAELPPWISRYNTKSPHLREVTIKDGRLLLRSQTRSALSRLKSVTTLTLEDVEFLSFSEFARIVCALPNLSTLKLLRVTVNDSRSYSLKGVYFARNLGLKKLKIWNCEFGETHAIWNLLTAPSLSHSLKHIEALTPASDPEEALQNLFLPPAALLSNRLGRLNRLQFEPWALFCSSEAVYSLVLGLLSRGPARRVTAIEIYYRCSDSPPCLHTLEALFTALDSSVAAVNFAALRTISVSFKTWCPFIVNNIRTMVDSQSHSLEWTERFTMSSMAFTGKGIDKILCSGERISETTEATVEAFRSEVALEIRLDSDFVTIDPYPYTATVVYTRRSGL